MAAFVVEVHNAFERVMSSSKREEKDLNLKIGDELLKLTRAVVKKNTLPPKKAYKFHLAQSARMLSRSVVHWNKLIKRRLRRKTNGSSPWTVRFDRHMPLEVFSCFKAASLGDENENEGGGVLVKNTKNIEEIKFENKNDLVALLVEFANKYNVCVQEGEMLFKMEKDGSYSTVIVNQDHPAMFRYSKTLEMVHFKARYGFYNRLGVPQFSL